MINLSMVEYFKTETLILASRYQDEEQTWNALEFETIIFNDDDRKTILRQCRKLLNTIFEV